MKRVSSILLLVCLLCCLVTSATAHVKKEHNKYLERVLFGRDNYASSLPEQQRLALKALEDATYLAIDQYNGNGSAELTFLRNDYGVPGLPNSISAIDYSANQYHRSYTHRGWYYEYANDLANWSIRRNILLATTEKVFDFSLVSGKVLGIDFGYHKKCESFAALMYYVHLLSDYEASEGYKVADVMIPFAQAHPSESNRDIIYELKYHLSVLFKDQQHTHKYADLMNGLDTIGKTARNHVSTTGGINSYEKFIAIKADISAVLKLLQDYVPNMLKQEEFFTKVFPR